VWPFPAELRILVVVSVELVIVELDESDTVDMDAMPFGRGVHGTTVWLEVVEREEEDDDLEGVGESS
jgi:hypothetical protein